MLVESILIDMLEASAGSQGMQRGHGKGTGVAIVPLEKEIIDSKKSNATLRKQLTLNISETMIGQQPVNFGDYARMQKGWIGQKL